MSEVIVHFIRHGRVASHRGDIPVTEEGVREIEAVGERFAGEIQRGEEVFLPTAPTRRARETAETLERVLRPRIAGGAFTLHAPADEWAIRNPDIYIGGMRVEMVSTPEAMAEQTAAIGVGPEITGALPFYRDFFPSPDRIGYWVHHADPPGEDANAVARRLMSWAISLRDLPGGHTRRYLASTHSPLLRAFLLRYVLTEDRGEPKFGESVDVVISESEVSVSYREVERRMSIPAALSVGIQQPAL